MSDFWQGFVVFPISLAGVYIGLATTSIFYKSIRDTNRSFRPHVKWKEGYGLTWISRRYWLAYVWIRSLFDHMSWQIDAWYRGYEIETIRSRNHK